MGFASRFSVPVLLASLFLSGPLSGSLWGAEDPEEAFLKETSPQSLSFADAAVLAVSSSAELRNAYAEQGIREKAWLLGMRAYLPKLSLSISENDRLQQIGADSFVKNYSLNAEQLLWDGGRTSMGRKLEKMDLNLSHSRLERSAADIGEAALSAYRSVLSARAMLEIRRDSFRSLEEQRRILAEELRLGLALQADLAEADLALAEERITIHSLDSDLVELEQQFADILGLDALPELKEKVDPCRETFLPQAVHARSMAEERNPDLGEARFSITKKQGELKYISHSWIPTLRLTGSFGLTGRDYPLNHYTWSLGLGIDFSGPWIQNSFGLQAGWEPPHDKTAQLQNSLSPLPDPAAGLNKHQAELALALEKEKFRLAFEQIGRGAQRGVEKCSLADTKRRLALEAAGLAAERCRLEELRLSLGQITRIELMEVMIEYTGKETAAVEAAVALLEAERELERLLDLKPGELAVFAAQSNRSE
jgi:outer membrane protein TolC